MEQFDFRDYTVFLVEGFTKWNENAYVLLDKTTKEAAVIDPGGGVEEISKILKDNQATAKYVLLTHAHHDHMVSAAEICDLLQLPCTLHTADLRLLKQAPNYGLLFDKMKLRVPEKTVQLTTEEDLPFGTSVIKIMHTPGHTAGSLCYCLSESAFTGDIILREGKGRTDLPGGNVELLHASVARVLETLKGETKLFIGHGAPITVEEARHL